MYILCRQVSIHYILNIDSMLLSCSARDV